MRALPAVAALALALAAAGCFLPGFERDDGTTATTSATTSGSGGAGGSTTSGPMFCESAAFPPAPMGGSGGAPSLDLAFALRTVDLGETDVAHRPGFDLDRVCSCCTDCETDGDACTPPAFASEGAACDADDAGGSGNQGRDNALAKVIASFGMLGSQLPVGSNSMNQRIESGLWSVLVRVDGYDGLADDDHVTVSLFTTDGTDGVMPKWDGTDVWRIRSDSLDGSYATLPDPKDAATVLNANAYVSGGRLVGVFDGAPGSTNRLALNLNGGFSLTLTSAIFSADLVETPQGWTLANGTMGGIWNLVDVFKSLSAIRPPLCTDDQVYAFFKPRLCEYVDIRQGAPAPQPCDALSFGLSFTAAPIVFGTVKAATASGPGCPAATDPISDSCNP